jgi:hypothetical protein
MNPVPVVLGRLRTSWTATALSQKVSPYAVLSAFWIPLIAVVLRLASSATGNASYVLIAAYALVGPRQAIVSLYLCWLFNMINHGLAPVAGLAAILRHLTIFCAFLSVLLHGSGRARGKADWLVPATVVLCGYLIIHSLLFSQQTDVSLLKAISFSMTVVALTVGWSSLAEKERRLTELFLFGSLGAIAVASVPFVASPIGYYRNGQGFQGILVHPQNFGPSMAVLAALLMSQSLAGKKLRLSSGVLLAICVVSIYLSKARIAGLALVGGLVLGVGCEVIRAWLARRRSRESLRMSRLALGATIALLVAIAAGPWIASQLSDFIRKGSRAETVTEAALQSRGRKIDGMMANIEHHPLFGIGFGIDAGTDYFLIQRDPVFGLPVMATVEKGVMPVAVIEETGIIGALITYPWLLLLLFRAVRGGMITDTVFWSVLVTNIAEACLFSPGGQGMFQLIFAIWASTAPTEQVHANQSRRGTARRAA